MKGNGQSVQSQLYVCLARMALLEDTCKHDPVLKSEWLSPDNSDGLLVMDFGATKSDLNRTLTPK